MTIRERLEEIKRQWDSFENQPNPLELITIIESLLEEKEEMLRKITSCTGYVRSECLVCDEAGACVLDAVAALSKEADDGSD